MKSRAEILSVIKKGIAKETGLSVSEIGDDDSFYSLGLDSISSVMMLNELEKNLKTELNPLLFWDFPTVGLLADHLASLGTNE